VNCWWRPPLAGLLILALLLDGCAPGLKRQLGTPAVVTTASEPARSPYLNAHLRDGRFIAFNEWGVDSTGTVVTGNGRLLDASRNLVTAGPLSVPIDSVAIFEANSPTAMPPAMRALLIVLVGTAILAGVALIALAIACASNPKCFGSCPTFYVDDGERASLMAEGFSASVAPALEDTDVDALYRARPRGRAFEVTMKNEALETHVVRFVHVLAAPRLPGGRVFAAVDGSYWQTSAPRDARPRVPGRWR